MTQKHQIAIRQLRAWMKDVLAHENWSCEKWARNAGVAPTTITRFHNNQTDRLPSTTTLLKLAACTSTPLSPLVLRDNTIKRTVPVYDNTDQYLSRRDQNFSSLKMPHDTASFGVRIETDNLSHKGLYRNDIAFIDPDLPLSNGSIVATVYKKKIVLWVVSDANFIGAHNTTVARSNEKVLVIGRVISVTRQL